MASSSMSERHTARAVKKANKRRSSARSISIAAVLAQTALVAVSLPPASCLAGNPATTAAGLSASLSSGARVAPLNPQVSSPLYPPYALFSFCQQNTPTVPGTGEPWFWERCPRVVPLTDPQVRKAAPGCAPEQASVKLWETRAGKGRASVLLSFATCAGGGPEGSFPPTWNGWQPDPLAAAPLPTAAAVTDVAVGVAPGVYTHGGCSSTAVTSYSENWPASPGSGPQGGGSYTSPILHHCLLKNLTAGVKYYYKIKDAPQLPGTTSTSGANSPYYGSFTVPRAAFPLRVGVAGDPGQLLNSTLTRDILVAQKPDVLLITGDVAYADIGTFNPQQFGGIEGFANASAFYYEFGVNQYQWGGRWDTFARLWKSLLASVPTVTTLGNHESSEMEPFPTPFYAQSPPNASCSNFACPWSFASRQKAYNARFPTPGSPQQLARGPTPQSLGPVVASDPAGTATRNAWSVREVANVATVITLSAYIFNDDFTTSSEQYRWFEETLQKVDRARTPWLVVMWHSPWYATYAKHWRELECMRKTYEPLFKKYGVDVAFQGHDHAYERSFPTFDNAPDLACGTTHLCVGGGGSEDMTMGYIDVVKGTNSPLGYYKATYCNADGSLNASNPFWPVYYTVQAPGQFGPGGRCSMPAEVLCPKAQPAYSAFRDQGYGAGVLDLLSPTEARWRWFAHRDPSKPLDEVFIKRSPERELACGVAAASVSGGGKAADYARAAAALAAAPLNGAGAVASEGAAAAGASSNASTSLDAGGLTAAASSAAGSAARGVAWKAGTVELELRRAVDAAAAALGKSSVNVTQEQYYVALAGGGRRRRRE